jgi:hypothetical protein
MAIDKFTFISPGIFLSEVDESQNPIAPEVMGPVIIGRTRKGPAMRPVKVRSYSEFIDIFGDVHAGGVVDGDAWRSGAFTGPTYAGYAAKAWLAAGTAPATIVRLLGEDNTAAASTTSGWSTTKTTPSAVSLDNGGAVGLFVINSGAIDSHHTGTLAAIWYIDEGSQMVLSGTVRGTAGGSDHLDTGSNGILIKSSAQNQFEASLYHADAKAYDFGTFNFDVNSPNYIRRVFNTTPSLTNSDVTDTTSLSFGENRYWLGETFERAAADNTSGADQWGMILPLMSGTAAGWHDRKGAWQNAQTSWYFSQDFGLNTAYDAYSTVTKLFKFHALDYGAWANGNLKIAIEDIRAATTPTSKWGSFSVSVYPASTYDKVAKSEALEKFTQCSLDPESPDYVAYKVGDKYLTWSDANKIHTENGEYANKSKYIRIEMNPAVKDGGVNESCLPFGVYGPVRSVGFSYASGSNTLRPKSLTPLGEESDVQATLVDAIVTTGVAENDTFTITLPAAAGGDATAHAIIFVADATAVAALSNANNWGIDIANADDAPKAATAIVNAINGATHAHIGYGGNAVESFLAAGTLGLTAAIGSTTSKVTLTMDARGAHGNIASVLSVGTGFEVASDLLKTSAFTGGASAGYAACFASGGVGFAKSSATSKDAIIVANPHSAVLSVHAFSGSWVFPGPAMRSSSNDAGDGLGKKAYFGVQTTRLSTTSRADSGYGDYTIGLPIDSTVTRFDTLSGAPTNTEYSWAFSLDQISSSAVPYYHQSGSRKTGLSLTAQNSSYKSVLEHIRQFWAPMYGGTDGLDITEPEPFRNSQWTGASTATNNAMFNTIQRSIYTVEDPEAVECNILVVPGITKVALTDQVIETCQERADALGIIDLEGDYTPYTENTSDYATRLGSVSTTVTNIQTRDLNNSYACAYYPWVQIKDTKSDRLLYVPPSVVALGTFGSSEAVAELWFAPAGFNRGGLSGPGAGSAGLPVVGVVERLTSSKRDDLYENNINPIAKFPAEGIVIFGQKTLQQTSSALDRINVRRLMIYVKKEISRIAATILFDQNDSVTWGRFLSKVEPFLSDIRSRYGLTDFKVVLDETTTTPDLIDRNILYAKVFLKPARSIEYIAIDFVIARTGASFAD